MKSIEVGHSIENEIEHKKNIRVHCMYIMWNFKYVRVCAVISKVFLTASWSKNILEAIVQVSLFSAILSLF